MSRRAKKIMGVPGFDFGGKVFRAPAVDFLMDAGSHAILRETSYTFRARTSDIAACTAEANLNRLLHTALMHKDKWTRKEDKPAFLQAICNSLGDGSPGIIEFLLRAAMTARRRHQNRAKKRDEMKKEEEGEDMALAPLVVAADKLCRHEAFMVARGVPTG